ncbi:putative Copper homeostasis protein cutC-like protein [Operophtera brumata]|uniref:Copper homeostasis protein cutC homolog n=1 Tax=Operophtera brumata TaxID=104452 RepID=A0A0L7KVY2_OPEBR|nr:putative Copper homeostasis protein cutC-like protein [Operophtera brumata]
MIRCRGGDDFYYSDYEMQHMLRDLKIFKDMGVDQFVFGALTDNQEIDESKCMRVLAAASPNKVTFSRAFDHTRESKRSAGILAGLGFYRVLTSGQRESVNEPGAVQIISYLVTRHSSGSDELIIMPGGGVNSGNVAAFINMGCQIVHSTCRSALQLPKIERLNKLGVSDSNCVYFSDYDVVRELKDAIMAAVHEKETE